MDDLTYRSWTEVAFMAAKIYGIRSIALFMSLKSASRSTRPKRGIGGDTSARETRAFPSLFYGREMNISIWSPPTDKERIWSAMVHIAWIFIEPP